MAVIDTLGIAEELAKDGVFTREQAERLARMSAKAATEALATKADVATIRSDIAALRTDLFEEIGRTRADLERALAETRADLERSMAQMRTDLEHSILVNRREVEGQIQSSVKEVVKWAAGILLAHGIAVIGVTVTLVKLL